MLFNRLEIICIIHQYTCIGIIRIINPGDENPGYLYSIALLLLCPGIF